MKEWFKKFDKAIIALLLFVVTYIIICSISTNYIHFDNNNRYRAQSRSEYERRAYHSQNEHNVKVARFYFIQLPFGAAVPSLLYLLFSFIGQKKSSKNKEEEVLSNCLVRTPYIKSTQSSLFYSLRESSFDKYWPIISMHIDKALEYMFTHPNEFHVGETIIDEPQWEENSYFRETIYVNGKKLIIFMRYKTFLADLNNCVQEITKNK